MFLQKADIKMDEEQAKSFLDSNLGQESATNTPSSQPVTSQNEFSGTQPAQPAQPSLTPKTDVASLYQSIPSPIAKLEEMKKAKDERYIQANKEPGTPLDIETGASPWERFWVGSIRDKDSALSYMQKKYGPKNVRLDKEGDFVFRVPDSESEGKMKDIKFHPNKISWGDATELAANIPEIAGGILAIMGGRKVPQVGKLKGFLGLSRDVVAGAAGAESVGAAKDIGLNTLEQGQPNIPETAKDRGVMAASDVSLGYGTYGAGRFFKFLGSPFSGSKGPIQFKMDEARDFFKNNPKYGLDVPMSASELTGSPILGRAEVYTEIQPGGYGPLKKLKGEQEQSLLKLQKIMTGYGPPPSDADILKRVQLGVSPTLTGAETGLSSAKKEVAQSAEKIIGENVSALSTPEMQLYRDATGREVRAGVIARQKSAMDEASALYAKADELGAKDKTIDGTYLQKQLKSVIKDLPSAKVSKISEVTGDTLKGTKVEPLQKWPPDKLVGRIQEILDLKNPQFSISDLKQMRSDIYDDIAKSPGVPDLKAHYLSQVGDAITKTINQSIEKMPSGDLKVALQGADKFWKEKVVPFNRPGITELFRREGEAGFVSDDEVITRIFSTAKTPSISTQNYKLMRETLGADSPEFSKVKRSLLDHIIEGNKTTEDTIDARGLINTLKDLRTNYRTVADDVFGTKLNSLFQEAKSIDLGGSKISAEDLQGLLDSKSPTIEKLKTLVVKQQKLDELYRNNLLSDISKNKLVPGSINPTDFVSRFIENPKTSEEDIKGVLSLLAHSPSTLEDIQTKTIQTILDSAGTRVTGANISKTFSEQSSRVASSTGIVKAIDKIGGPKKLQILIGNEKYNELEQYFNLVSGTEYKYASSGYTMAGAFAATSTVKSLEHLDLIKFAKPTIANWFVAKVLTNPVFRQWAGHVPKNPDPGFISLFLSSPTFLSEVSKDFPGARGTAFISSLKQSMDDWVRAKVGDEKASPKTSPQSEERKTWEDFLNKSLVESSKPGNPNKSGKKQTNSLP
jgi:hypothetical protein